MSSHLYLMYDLSIATILKTSIVVVHTYRKGVEMNLQSMQISLPNVNRRPVAGPQAAEVAPAARAMRRSEAALLDGFQAWIRAGHSLTVLMGVDHPGPAFTYDLPVVRAVAPLIAAPYGVLIDLLNHLSYLS